MKTTHNGSFKIRISIILPTLELYLISNYSLQVSVKNILQNQVRTVKIENTLY